MRALGAIVAAVCAIGLAMPAHALGMKFCDDIKDDQSRLACLQEHISQLEETIVALGGQVATLEHELEQKLSEGVTYKLRSVAQGKCLGFDGDNKPPTLVTCDHPDAWALLAGPPIKKEQKKPASTPNPVSNSVDSGTQPAGAPAAPQPQSNNPCRGLDQAACAAKTASCTWKADKNKCGRNGSEKTP